MHLRKVENSPVRSKISVVDSGFKGYLQDKPMQEISETMEMDCVKFERGCKVILLVDPNGIHKNMMLKISSY